MDLKLLWLLQAVQEFKDVKCNIEYKKELCVFRSFYTLRYFLSLLSGCLGRN
ncbi:hypothetical protein Hanom_Chr12g01102551 [Helianthus anomalus]